MTQFTLIFVTACHKYDQANCYGYNNSEHDNHNNQIFETFTCISDDFTYKCTNISIGWKSIVDWTPDWKI